MGLPDQVLDREPFGGKQPGMTTFPTGATRSAEGKKLDFEGFLDPQVLTRYAEYLNAHRVQADGKVRDSDNWQKGIPVQNYAKSLIRHVFDAWRIHRGNIVRDRDTGKIIELQDALSAVLFNAMGWMRELLQGPKLGTAIQYDGPRPPEKYENRLQPVGVCGESEPFLHSHRCVLHEGHLLLHNCGQGGMWE